MSSLQEWKRPGDKTPLTDVQVREVIDECKKSTRIAYSESGGFFDAKLKIDYLQSGRSNIISGPGTIFLEWCYLQIAKLRGWYRNLCTTLFPRNPRVWTGAHPEKLDSSLVGVVICEGDRGHGAPIHHLHLEFWGRTWLGGWRKLGQTRTDKHGRFELFFDLRESRRLWVRKLYLEFHNTSRIYFHRNEPYLHFDLFRRQSVKKSDLIGMKYSLGTLRLDHWRYCPDAKTPRALIKNVLTDAPEYYTDQRIDSMLEQMLPVELTLLKHERQIALDPTSISIPQIQQDYPMNLTTCIEQHIPGYTRGDDWFGERMMNGMNRAYFEQDPEKPNHYWVRYYGKCWYQSNDIYAQPDVEMCFMLKPNGLPTPVEIHLTGRLSKHEPESVGKRIFTPNDGDKWNQAKRVARVAGGLCTEVEEHFAGTHLNAEQFAIAANRNLKLNPIATLLLPHLKEVSLINHQANQVLIGDKEGYIPRASAMTEEGLNQRARDILGVQDWKGFKPMEPISDSHTYARAEQLFWEVAGEYVDTFFKSRERLIKHYWYEIFCFSEDLVKHAVPIAFTASQDSPAHEYECLKNRRFQYYCGQYRFDPTIMRPTIDGETRALSRITAAQSFDQAAPEDWQNLKDACRYAIMIATFMHTWINEHQYDDIGEVLYSSLGLRFGVGPDGIMAPEEDYRIAPDLKTSSGMLWFSNFLSRTEYGFITREPSHDVNPLFARLLEAKKAEFKKLGIDIASIECSTNI
jgi:hypothetical protein